MKKAKKLIPVLVVFFMIIVIVLMMFLGRVIDKYTPTDETADLSEYYNISEDDQVAILFDHALSEEQGIYKNGMVYLDFTTLRSELNSRFYWDSNENLLLYTTPTDVITANMGENAYYISKEKQDTSYQVWFADGNQAYIALDYIKLYTALDYSIAEEPYRVMITTEYGAIQKVNVEQATQLRVRGGIKSPILKELEETESLTLLDEGEDWDKVATQDGLIGYVQSRRLGDVEEFVLESSFEEPVFTHTLKDYVISMGWHQVTSQAANSSVSSVITNTKGMNVISPTWFYLNDNDGNLMNLASSDYVNYCHQNGIEVWALVSNLENESVDTTQILNTTSKRTNVVNQLIAAAIQYDLDGINVDFESLSVDAGLGYIQFIRELSLKCRNNGIILSVDNYVPSEYTSFYNREEQANFADYVVIMAYDEHFSGSEEEGSVASIGFVQQGITDTLSEVPAEQIILGIPFYTRIWALTPKDDAGDSVESAAEDYVPYELSSSAVGMQEAWNQANVNGVDPVWMEEYGQYYAEYENSGITYKIWLEDATSIELKLQEMQASQLAGAAFWKLGFEDSSLWETIIKYMTR